MSVSGASLVSRENEETKLRSMTSTPRGENDEEMHSTSRDLLPTPAIQSISTSVLVRTYLVYTLCSIPLLIDYAPSLLHTFTHSPIPGVKQVTEAIVRRTFFAQFVPGESVEECLPTMRDLRKNGIGAVLNYSAEVSLDGDEKLTDEKRRLFEEKRLQEVEKALIESGRFEAQIGQQGLKQGSTSFALKVVSFPLPDLSQMPDS
jgi:proline dehydrogenase